MEMNVLSNFIEINGINTNNLKSLDIKIPKNKIIAITGVSGGGKTSLAYDTIYSLCKQEFKSIESGYFEDARYDIQSANGLVPSVAIKQKNTNINPRSTLYSYLNISSIVAASKKNSETNVPLSFLKLNSPTNECLTCSGLREINSININKVILWDTPILENPFIPWRANQSSEKYSKLLIAYCNDVGIDANKTLNMLSKNIVKNILYNESEKEYAVSFKYNGKRRSRKIKYYGIMRELDDHSRSDKISMKQLANKYSDINPCPNCHSTGINKDKYKSYKVGNISFFNLLDFTIEKLIKTLKPTNEGNLSILIKLLESIADIGLGYLRLSRSIPTLSGGELQKLNFCKLQNTNISNIAVIIDEISSQLHVSDFENIISGIRSINNKKNTVILVEHNNTFLKIANLIITIGPKAGANGGYIVKNSTKSVISINSSKPRTYEYLEFKNICIHNIDKLNIKIPRNEITALVGKSGSGKSSLAKYINNNHDNIIYISQSLIRGNIRSNVSTILGLNKIVADIYSKNTNLDNTFFNPTPDSEGSCTTCNGSGILRYERSFEKSIDAICPNCQGMLFSPKTDEYKVYGLNISRFYSLTFEELCSYPEILGPIKSHLNAICELGLGHLSLNRKTQSLSGGELRRLKLLSTFMTKSRNKNILIIDEPGAGLDDVTAKKVIQFIKQQIENFTSIIVIDHKPSIFLEVGHIIEMGPGSGDSGGKIVFQGSPSDYFNAQYRPYLDNLN